MEVLILADEHSLRPISLDLAKLLGDVVRSGRGSPRVSFELLDEGRNDSIYCTVDGIQSMFAPELHLTIKRIFLIIYVC